jgi:hypothetical protein
MRIYIIERKERKRGREKRITKDYAYNNEDYGLNKEVFEELPIHTQCLNFSSYIIQ